LRKIIIFLTLEDNPQIDRHAQTFVIVKEKLKNTQVLWNLSVFTQNEGVKWSVNNLNVIKKVLKKNRQKQKYAVYKHRNQNMSNTDAHQYISSLELRYSRRVCSKGKLGYYMYIHRLQCKPNHPVITILYTNTFLWSLINKMRDNYFFNAKANPVLY